MINNVPHPPERSPLELMTGKVYVRWRDKHLSELEAQASPPEVLESQMRQENAFRKWLQQMRDQRNGY